MSNRQPEPPCQCRCHAGGPYADCDVSRSSTGVPGALSCSPCDGGPRLCPGRDCKTELRRGDFLCRACAGKAASTARHLPELLADLDDTIAKQARAGGRGGGGIGRGGASKAPVNFEALAKRQHVATLIEYAVKLGYQPPSLEFADVMATVAAKPARMRTRLDGPDYSLMLHRAASSWRNLVDPGSERVYAGTCPVCEAQLFTTRDSRDTVCRGCGAKYDTETSLAGVDAAVRAADGEVLEVRTIVAERAGIRVKPSTLSMWRSRMKLRTWCRVSDRAVMCQVGEYLDLAKALRTPSEPDSAGA